MTASVYEQHDKAFAKVSAWVILDDKGERVATVAIKFPRDGAGRPAGRLWAYAHVMGVEMQRAYADGYGYDKRSPAVRDAFGKAKPRDQGPLENYAADLAVRDRINAALAVSDGEYWDRLLERAGFRVLQAV